VTPDGIVVQQMMPPGLEAIVGTLTDPEFGPIVMVGAGGTSANLINDRVFRLAPISATEAFAAVTSLRIFPQSESETLRSSPDWQALADLVATVSQLAWQSRSRLSGLDLNPVLVLPEGSGTVVLDGSAELRTSAGS
jgi:acetate---CoA ligase (ADP-forming)